MEGSEEGEVDEDEEAREEERGATKYEYCGRRSGGKGAEKRKREHA